VRSAIIQVIVAGVLSNQALALEAPARANEQILAENKLFLAGACAVAISPQSLPVLVNGGFLQARATRINDPIMAKCLVLDDGSNRLAIVVVDSCMMPRELIDDAKVRARDRTGIPVERMLISATHTHSAPAAMGALGCPADAGYAAYLPGRIAESIAGALRNLAPARVGWAVIDDDSHTFCRRWIRRPDRILEDPFGERTVRANMHPGYQSPDVIGPAGPVDPGLTILAVQSKSGRPVAVLANYSMHYYGAEPISADYFGRFASALAVHLSAQDVDPPFVGMMSQGTSGDQMWMDYGQPRKDPGLDTYAADVAKVASVAYRSIKYHDWVPLAIAETTLTLKRRVPGATRLAWAKAILARMNDHDPKRGQDNVPRSLPEVYAQEAVFLHSQPERELKLQAVRVGELGIDAIPNEVFAITGLKIKAESPFDNTMNIELANGAEGYIPPPEQHALGGYTTWPARTAALEIQAEPKIVATVLKLLEQVAGKRRRGLRIGETAYSQAVLGSRPRAYWRLDDIQGPGAFDTAANAQNGRFEEGVALYLPGVDLAGASPRASLNRAAHFAGGKFKVNLDRHNDSYTVELWFWNGLPTNARSVTGHLFSFGSDAAVNASGDEISIAGTGMASPHLYFASQNTATSVLAGKTEIVRKTWYHLAFVRNGRHVSVYLNGNPEPEITGDVDAGAVSRRMVFLIAGRSDGQSNFEGKLDEVAFFDRALSPQEIGRHVQAAQAAGRTAPTNLP
jgi:hypothetical protein